MTQDNSFTPPDTQVIQSILDRLSKIERVLEIPTTDQISERLITLGTITTPASLATAIAGHDTQHDDRFALIDHDTAHDDRFALIHSHPYAATEHDTAHDDVFSPIGHAHYVNGTYTGDGTTAAGGRQITTGFIPSMVIIVAGTSTATVEQLIVFNTSGATYIDNGGNISYTTHAHLHTTNGFVVGDTAGSGANTNLKIYKYLAFG